MSGQEPLIVASTLFGLLLKLGRVFQLEVFRECLCQGVLRFAVLREDEHARAVCFAVPADRFKLLLEQLIAR